MVKDKEILFETLEEAELKLLIRAYGYDIDTKGDILSPSGKKMQSEEMPSEYLNIKNVALVPGSLKPIDGSPTAISKFIREEIEESHDTTN